MDRKPAVSVVIPTRDALGWLPAAIDSVGFSPDAEILVVDDGSTDGTLAWLGERAAADPRIRFLHGAHAGPARARNLAISAARAPLTAFLDADDRWLPGKLEAQLALHNGHPDIGLSFTDYRRVTTDGKVGGGGFQSWPRFWSEIGGRTEPFILQKPLAALYAENVVGTSTAMVRTALLREVGGFSTGLNSAEDWDLWLALAQRAPVGVIPVVAAEYLIHRSGNEGGRLDLRMMAMTLIAERYRSAALAQDRTVERVFQSRMCSGHAEIAALAGRRLNAVAWCLRALWRQPTRRSMRELLVALRALIRGNNTEATGVSACRTGR